MNIAFLSSSISRNGGGVSEVKRCLAQKLIKNPEIDIQVFGLEDEHANKDFNLWAPMRPHICKTLGPQSIAYSPRLITALKESGADLIHLHGLWQYPSYAASKSGIPYITTIHGMLDRWAIKNSGFKKKAAGILYEYSALKNASCLHAITMQEYYDIRNFGLKNPVCISPNGVDVPEEIEELKSKKPLWSDKITQGSKVLLYLGRLHPKKGLKNLLEAWQQVYNTSPGWNLAIAGWNQGTYEEELKKLTEELNITDSVHFLGPQFGANKQLAFSHADGFILPSFSEGLPMVVLEAWSFNLPVLLTPQCNLPEGISSGAAFLIEPSVQSIADGLQTLFASTNDELKSMGSAGKKLVIEKFNWNSVADNMAEVYKWILKKGPIPETVQIT